jgi:hypothetical protein
MQISGYTVSPEQVAREWGSKGTRRIDCGSGSMSHAARPGRASLLGTKFLGLGYPAVDATRQAHFLADLMAGR